MSRVFDSVPRKYLALASAICTICAGSALFVSARADSSDRVVLVFPSFAVQDGDASWKADVHGWIYEPVGDGEGGRRRQVFEQFLFTSFGLSRGDLEKEARTGVSHLARRSAIFFANNKKERVDISVQGASESEESERNGHFVQDVKFRREGTRSGEWVDVKVVRRDGPPTASGRLQLIGPSGVSVVSDIDDTIKISNVGDKVQLGLNTFVRDFVPAPGMAALYRGWESSGAVFHYVSGSPYQLYPDLAAFVQRDRLPSGSFHLRRLRPWDGSVFDFFGDPKKFKLAEIRTLLTQFKDRRFVLVGDSGEQDPEVYAELAGKHKNISAILIRDVTRATRPARHQEIEKLFAPLPKSVERRMFTETAELAAFTLPQ